MKKRFSIYSAILLLSFTSSCNAQAATSSNEEINPNVLNQYLLRKPVEGDSINWQEYQSEKYQNILKKFDDFSANFTQEYCLTNAEDENISISPLSVYMALSLASCCTANETQTQILQALKMTEEEVPYFIKILYNLSNRQFHDTLNPEASALEKITNSLWFDQGISLKEDCLNDLVENYYCYPYQVDFKNNNLVANQAVQAFVKQQTYGLIDHNFNLTEDTLMAIINTLYLKDIWNSEGIDLPFTNTEYEFQNKNQELIHKTMLQGYYHLGRVYETESFTHFYTQTEHNYKIKFMIPKEGYTLSSIMTQENMNLVQQIKNYRAEDDVLMQRYHTRCIFPEFEAKCNENIQKILEQSFGIKNLFSPSLADFSSICDSNQMYCDSIIHQTELKVKKEGIEGAAVTIMIICGESMPEPDPYQDVYQDFIVNKAFGYILCDPQDIPLFSGVITNID